MKLVKDICPPGTFHVNRLNGGRGEETFTPERMEKWVSTFRQMRAAGLRVPAPFRHDPSAVPSDKQLAADDSRNNAGWWDELFIGADGKLKGILDVPDDHPDAGKIGTTIQEVSPLVLSKWKDGAGREWEDAMLHIACVTHPIVPGQANFEPLPEGAPLASAMSFSMSQMANPAQPPKNEGPTGSLMDLIKKLRSMQPPIELPADTTNENLAERLSVAVGAIVASQRGGEDGPLGSPVEQPAPIVMSHSTESPAMPTDPAVVALSNVIAENRRTDYRSRLDKLVSTGRLTPAARKEQLDSLVEGFQLSLDPTTHQPLPCTRDTVLGVLESQPEAHVRLAGSPQVVRSGRGGRLGGFAASHGQPAEESLSKDLLREPTGLAPIEDDAAFEKSIDAQIAQAGLRAG